MLRGDIANVVIKGSVARCGYVPHSLLFPHASLIVHHGGVGTTGQVMRAGKPHLVVPHMGDQNDHARRIERLGFGLSLRSSRFTVARAAPKIRRLLETKFFHQLASAAGAVIDLEDGARDAAQAIVMALSHAQVRRRDEQTKLVGV